MLIALYASTAALTVFTVGAVCYSWGYWRGAMMANRQWSEAHDRGDFG